jgi:hypothetical protein
MQEGSEQNQEQKDTTDRVIRRRRLLAAAVAAVVYVTLLFSVGDSASASTTVHTVRYLVVFSGVYTVFSAVNSAVEYIREGELHADTADFVGGALTTVGLGVFYTEVLAAEGIPEIYLLAIAAFSVSGGMVLVMKA